MFMKENPDWKKKQKQKQKKLVASDQYFVASN